MRYSLNIRIKNIKDGVYTLSLTLHDALDMPKVKLKASCNNTSVKNAKRLEVYTEKIIDFTIVDNACLIDFIGDCLYDFTTQLEYINHKSSKEYTYNDNFAEKVKRSTLRHLE